MQCFNKMNNKVVKITSALLFISLILIVFRSWFLPGIIIAVDFDYLWNYDFFTLNMYAWNTLSGKGFGTYFVPYMWAYPIQSIPINFWGVFLGLPWEVVQRLTFFYPFLILATISSGYLFKSLFPDIKIFYFAPLIFLFNTYILNVTGGGQMIIAMAYALTPFTLGIFMKVASSEKPNLYLTILAGLILGIQFLLDIRIGYIITFAICLFLLSTLIHVKTTVGIFVKKLIFALGIPLVLVLLLHAFWLLPSIFVQQNAIGALGSIYSSKEAVLFFSFAKFENSIALLHPNWPENVFGKVSFMRPEFLLLPLLAFASLFFISKRSYRERQYILYFALLGLIGAFLAKGANDPFGHVYLYLFDNVPGFVMFRDPTKWYTLVALSYSILIPYTVWNVYNRLKVLRIPPSSKFSFIHQSKIFNIQNFFILLISSLLIFLIRPAIVGELNGTLRQHTVPNEYISLQKFLEQQPGFFRTLWMPTIQKYAYATNQHPAISAQDLFEKYDQKALTANLNNQNAEKMLQESGIKYIIVPYDSEGEIFLQDRRYSEEVYTSFLEMVRSITWLSESKDFGKIKVFSIENPKEHFWSNAENLSLSYKRISPVEYELAVKGAKKEDLVVFSENFDSNWVLETNGSQIQSKAYKDTFNSFPLPKDGNYSAKVFYTPQVWVNIGIIVSVISLISIIGVLIYFRK